MFLFTSRLKVQIVQLAYGKLKQKGKSILEGDRAITKKSYEGLGIIPKKAKYIDSLLVFNSKINPYKHYSWDVALEEVDQHRQVKRKQDDVEINLVEAPKTIQEGEVLTRYGQKEYRYKP